MRLSDHLNTARQCVNDAAELGNSRYRWTTPDIPTTEEGNRQRCSLSNASYFSNTHAVEFRKKADRRGVAYKAIAKRQPDIPRYPGLDRNTKSCHTCGRSGHNHYNCRLHMNPHCNCGSNPRCGSNENGSVTNIM